MCKSVGVPHDSDRRSVNKLSLRSEVAVSAFDLKGIFLPKVTGGLSVRQLPNPCIF